MSLNAKESCETFLECLKPEKSLARGDDGGRFEEVNVLDNNQMTDQDV